MNRLDNPNLRIVINRTQAGIKSPRWLRLPIKFEVAFDPENLPRIFQEDLVKAVDPFARGAEVNYWSYDDSYYGGSFDESLIKSYRGLKAISLHSSFHGIIPDESRERIQASQEMFGKDIYLVAERTPEDWAVDEYQRKVTVDPIAVGVLYNECYIVDHFNTSPLERYVMKEWGRD